MSQAGISPAARQKELAILLVNDDPGTLPALRSVLGDFDADIVTASSGEQALLRLLKQNFCAILMDVRMASLDGFETARLVRASDLDRERGFDVGASASDKLFMPVAPEV